MGKLDIQKIVSEELSELTEKEKRKILHDLDEAKVTPLKVSKAYDALAKVTAELLKNLKAYKDATTDSDKEKYKKVAATLTAKKKQAQKLLNSMIVQLDKDAELHLENIIRGELNESNAKDVFKFAKEALLQTTKGRRLDQRYVRDYLKSIEQMARKKPGQFVKDYKDFGVADWIEDVEYNMRNESVNESVEKDLMKAKKGAKAKGGGYGPFVKISGNSWKNPKTGRLMHSQALASHIGGFDDFIIEGKLNEAKEYRAGDTVKLKTGETVKINQVVKGPRPEFNTYRAKVKGKQVDFDSTDISEGKLTEGLNPVKAARVIFDKLAFAKLIGKQNRKRAEGIIEFQLRAMNFGEGKLSEANRGKVFTAAKKGSFPATIVVVQNGKVIHQEKVSTPEAAPAKFNVMQKKYPKALIHLEDNTGKRLFSEALNKGDVIKFKNGKSIVILGPKGDGYDYQERGRREKGHHPKGWFDMMIRTGKAVVEGKVNEATSLWKHFDAKMKLQDEIMDVEDEMRYITSGLKQLHIDMEQEAEPGGGPKATKYGKEIEKKEKEYKQKKAQFKKLMAKLDKMEQY